MDTAFSETSITFEKLIFRLYFFYIIVQRMTFSFNLYFFGGFVVVVTCYVGGRPKM